MQAVLDGDKQVTDLIRKKQASRLLEKTGRQLPTRVEIDNQVSEDYTVIDIYSQDKVGLLYLLSSTLSKLGLYIGVSRISTKVDQVADVFYVRDSAGQKITAEAELEKIRTTLIGAIDGW
jgi:[protein-PII] uridylyltransferase